MAVRGERGRGRVPGQGGILSLAAVQRAPAPLCGRTRPGLALGFHARTQALGFLPPALPPFRPPGSSPSFQRLWALFLPPYPTPLSSLCHPFPPVCILSPREGLCHPKRQPGRGPQTPEEGQVGDCPAWTLYCSHWDKVGASPLPLPGLRGLRLWDYYFGVQRAGRPPLSSPCCGLPASAGSESKAILAPLLPPRLCLALTFPLPSGSSLEGEAGCGEQSPGTGRLCARSPSSGPGGSFLFPSTPCGFPVRFPFAEYEVPP